MRSALYLFIVLTTCVPPVSAQVIQYEIDSSFNSGLLLNRGSVSDIIYTAENRIFVMGMFAGINSPVNRGVHLNSDGGLFDPVNIAGSFVVEYQNGFLQYGSDIRTFLSPPGVLNANFKFEFKKQAYSGPLSNKALDAMVLADDHILVAGRFFTDSTLMGTAESHLGLRQLCMIDSTGAPVEEFPMIRCAEPVSAEIYRVAELSSGGYVISGTFQMVDGHHTNHVARLHADFSVDTTFVSPFNFKSGAVVFIQFTDVEDRIILTGSNAELADNPDTYPGVVRILPDGLLDADFTIPDIVFVNPPSGIAYPIQPGMVIEDEDGTYIIAGVFQTVNGSPRKGIAKLFENGDLIEGSFEGFGVDEAVWGTWEGNPFAGVLYKLPDGKLLIGGQFSSFGGEPYSCLVRLQPAGFVGTDDRAKRGVLKVYPNPARRYFRIELPEGAERLESAELWDLQGRAVRAWPAGQKKFDIEGFPAGMYVVRAVGMNGSYTQKLILEP